MAKKKSQPISSKKVEEKPSKKDSMISKVEVKSPVDQEKISRIVGSVFIFLGILLISYGIYSFVKYSRTPELDDSLESPSVSGTEMLTKSDIVVKGSADGYDEVFIYIDNEEVSRVSVKSDSTFEYTHAVEKEGKYAVSVAGVKGFPKRYISSQSDMRIVEVDRTKPELAEVKYSEEVGTETFTLVGKVEPNAEVILRRGTDKYVVSCDENGDFTMENILLDEGPNVFEMELIDKAGNAVDVEEKIKITFSSDSSVNGNAVTDSLPVASGELTVAMRALFENSLMKVFALVALLSLMFSSGFVLLKYKGKK